MRTNVMLALGTAALALLAGASTHPADAAPKPTRYRLVLVGVWTQPGCAPTSASPDAGSQSASVECTGVATYSGHLNGYARQQISARGAASKTTARIVADIYGRTSGNLCGSLHLEPEQGVVADTGITGVGPITSGTGDFAGVTGWYDTTGFGVGGFGEGGYRITLDFPTKDAPAPGTTPCVPPLPGR